LDWLSYDFWQRCGLTSPGFCGQKVVSSPGGSGASYIPIGTSSGATFRAFATTICLVVALVLVTLLY
jgi:hypothetical protein